MLRVRPIHFTSRMDPWERLLSALGMVQDTSTTATGRSSTPARAASRCTVRPRRAGPVPGRTRTGTATEDRLRRRGRRPCGVRAAHQCWRERRLEHSPAELVRARCTATPAGSRARTGSASWRTRPPTAHSAPTPTLPWPSSKSGSRRTPPRPPQTLRNMGARLRPVPDDDETADFTAKNGGVLMVRPASGPARSGLGFEYNGDLAALRDRLAAGGPPGQHDGRGLRTDPARGQPGRGRRRRCRRAYAAHALDLEAGPRA